MVLGPPKHLKSPVFTNEELVDSNIECVVPNSDHVVTHSSPTEPSLQQGTESQMKLLKESDAPQKDCIEHPPKSSTSFYIPLSNVTDSIMDTSVLIGHNGDEQHPFILELVDQQTNVLWKSNVTMVRSPGTTTPFVVATTLHRCRDANGVGISHSLFAFKLTLALKK